MNKSEAEQLVINTFTHKFSEEQFTTFIRNLLPDIQPPSTRTIPNAQLPQGFREHVYNYTRVGTYNDPKGDVLDVVIVKLKNESSLDRARTRQRNLMAHYLNKRDKDAVLVAYITEDLSDWRFSFVKLAFQTEITDQGKVKVQQEYTPARRYSFLVGQHEPNHTAQKQLGDLLLSEGKPTLEQVEEAFNIESVTKEFFEDYKSLFLTIKENLDQIVNSKPKVKAEFDRCEIDTANFAKKLLGQIVFLYFLQKKGWLGVSEDKAWGTGDKKFLSNLFEKNKDKKFFDEILEPFFYEALAMERKGDFYPRLQCKVPFLNGGLFEPLNGYDWENISIGLANKDFEEVFRVFNLYNFTVREDEPLEKEVAVDPEMLGKVFENLLEVKDRKSKGAFYTPREIVHYMCQESLINYLDSELNNKSEKVSKEDLQEFIRKGEFSIERDRAREEGKLHDEGYGLPGSVREHANLIDNALADVKICDPAIGSGAFPVGMMTEIVRARRVLIPYLDIVNQKDTYYFKWHCIENSLYGVDIDSGAVEIAKLRLWLSLVVDEESYDHIRPLPNLDYRIVCGDSLNIIPKNLFNYMIYPELENKKLQYFSVTSRKNKEILREEIEGLIDQLSEGGSLFDFEIYFSEVFSSKKGFDIVIANPPYVSYGLRGVQKLTSKERKKIVEQYPNSAEYKISYYALFMDKAIQLAKPEYGIQSYIVPDSFLLGRYFSKIRSWILNNNQIIQISWLPYKIFQATVGYSVVYTYKRTPEKDPNHHIVARRISDNKKISEHSYQTYNYPQTYFESLLHNRFRLFFSKETKDLVEKIENGTSTIGKYYIGRTGVRSLVGQKKIKGKEKKGNTWQPGLISGSQITKYKITYDGDFININPKLLHKGGWDYEVIHNPKIFLRQTGDSLTAAIDYDNYYHLNNIHSFAPRSTNSNIKLHYLLAILNSQLMNWYYKTISLETGRTMAQTDIETIEGLPLKEASTKEQQQIIELVDQILINKKRGIDSTENFEMEIDQLIFNLYGLSQEEIALIERGD